MKCAINPSQTVNAKTGKSSKTCNLSKAWNEMNDLRYGRDISIDKSLTKDNVWMEGNSHDNLCEIVQKEVDRINEARNQAGLKSLRKDAVSCIEIVEKPNMEYMMNLSYEEKVKFLNDSHKVMSELIKEWNPNWKITHAVQHHDELSSHNHTMVMISTLDKSGTPCFNAKAEVNLKFFNHINKSYPAMMRSLGYTVEDVKTYDMLTEEEKQERKLNPKEHGVDAVTFKLKKERELNSKISSLEEKADQLEIKTKLQSAEYESKEQLLKDLAAAPDLKTYVDVMNENSTLKDELSFKDRVIERLEKEKEKLLESIESWKGKFSDLCQRLGSKILNFLGVDYDNSNLQVLPDKDVVAAFDDTKANSIKESYKNLRVIPSDTEGEYRLVCKQGDDYYITVKDHFLSREDAESWRDINKDRSIVLDNNLELKSIDIS